MKFKTIRRSMVHADQARMGHEAWKQESRDRLRRQSGGGDPAYAIAAQSERDTAVVDRRVHAEIMRWALARKEEGTWDD